MYAYILHIMTHDDVCVCVCVYIYIYIHTYIYIYVYIYIYIYIYVCMYAYILHIMTHDDVHMCVRVCVSIYTRTCVCVCVCLYIYIYIRRHMQYTHTYTYTYRLMTEATPLWACISRRRVSSFSLSALCTNSNASILWSNVCVLNSISCIVRVYAHMYVCMYVAYRSQPSALIQMLLSSGPMFAF